MAVDGRRHLQALFKPLHSPHDVCRRSHRAHNSLSCGAVVLYPSLSLYFFAIEPPLRSHSSTPSDALALPGTLSLLHVPALPGSLSSPFAARRHVHNQRRQTRRRAPIPFPTLLIAPNAGPRSFSPPPLFARHHCFSQHSSPHPTVKRQSPGPATTTSTPSAHDCTHALAISTPSREKTP
jgi:hypothetical protein